MNEIKQLEQLLKNDVLVEVNENIKELKEQISKTKKNKNLKEELEYMEQVRLYFDEVLVDIEHKKLTINDAIDILEGLEDMKVENQVI